MKFTNKILLTGTLLAGGWSICITDARGCVRGPGEPGSHVAINSISVSHPLLRARIPSRPHPSSPACSLRADSRDRPRVRPQPEQAPPPQPGRPSIDDQVRMLTQELSLNTDQQAKLKNILEDQHQQAMTFVNDANMSRDDKIQKIRVLREATITKARGIMNDDQKKKLDAMLQQQQPRQPAVAGQPAAAVQPAIAFQPARPPASLQRTVLRDSVSR